MLACRFNPETTALEIESWTSGPWTLPEEPRATRLEGSGWSLRFPEPAPYLMGLGLDEVDVVRLYEIDLTKAMDVNADVELHWEPDPDRVYGLLREAFAARWRAEGIAAEDWAEIWLGRDIDRQISGVAFVERHPVGFILAEDIDFPIGLAVAPQRFYRTFGILPEFQGKGLGLGLYRTSLQRAQESGVASARWVCFGSNRPIARLMDRLGARIVESQAFYQGILPLSGGSRGEIPA